jgi:23S rRNA (guanosine2251-2'-O)-methyltransferase
VILYGRNAVREALRGPRVVRQVWAGERAAREPWLRGVPGLRTVGGEELEERAGSPDHQGVCAEAAAYGYAGEEELLTAADPLLVVLDEIQDPQNLGAICRTAECAGATGVIIPERRAAEVTPAVCKASAGAVEHLRIARVRNIADFLAAAKRRDIWCYGASAEAGLAPDRLALTGGVALVLGSEGKGLRPRVRKACDQLVALPLRGQIESLNVGAAAAAILYEAVRQRGAVAGP